MFLLPSQVPVFTFSEKGKEKSTCSVVVTFQKVVCCSVIVHKYFRSFDILGSEVLTLLLVNQVHVSIYQDRFFTKEISFEKNVKRNVVVIVQKVGCCSVLIHGYFRNYPAPFPNQSAFCSGPPSFHICIALSLMIFLL